MPSPLHSANDAARLLTRLRAERPLVQCITNYVSMDIAANALLAIGASPAMVHAPEEVEDFLNLAGSLCVNIGTLSTDWIEGMRLAAEVACRLRKPWVLDPVGVGATRFRDDATAELLALKPAVVRGNASEIMASAKAAGLSHEAVVPKGVDSAHGTEAARAFAIGLAKHQRCVVAATGAIDLVTDGERTIEIANGSPLMSKVTALGCALSATVAAFAAIEPDFLRATTAAVGAYGVAGEIAADKASHPGGFRVAFLDALDAMTEADLERRIKLR